MREFEFVVHKGLMPHFVKVSYGEFSRGGWHVYIDGYYCGRVWDGGSDLNTDLFTVDELWDEIWKRKVL